MSSTPTASTRPGPAVHARNEVVLCGRVAAAAEARELPSGDTIVTVRIVVDRDAASMTRSKQRVDTLDCVAWTGRAQRSVRAWEAGQQVRVEGAVRRRFFRGAGGAASRVEIEIRSARRITASGVTRQPTP